MITALDFPSKLIGPPFTMAKSLLPQSQQDPLVSTVCLQLASFPPPVVSAMINGQCPVWRAAHP
jgi:hypothetical protein